MLINVLTVKFSLVKSFCVLLLSAEYWCVRCLIWADKWSGSEFKMFTGTLYYQRSRWYDTCLPERRSRTKLFTGTSFPSFPHDYTPEQVSHSVSAL